MGNGKIIIHKLLSIRNWFLANSFSPHSFPLSAKLKFCGICIRSSFEDFAQAWCGICSVNNLWANVNILKTFLQMILFWESFGLAFCTRGICIQVKLKTTYSWHFSVHTLYTIFWSFCSATDSCNALTSYFGSSTTTTTSAFTIKVTQEKFSWIINKKN